MLPDKSWLLRVSDRSSRVLVPTFSVVSPVLVSCPSMTVRVPPAHDISLFQLLTISTEAQLLLFGKAFKGGSG